MDMDEYAYKACYVSVKNYYIPAKPEEADSLRANPIEEVKKRGYSNKEDCIIWGIGDSQDLIIHKIETIANISSALRLIDRMVKERLSIPGIDEIVFCYGMGHNFRYDVAKINPYKGHRPSQKPQQLPEVIDYILGKYNVISEDGIETDDILGKEHTKPGADTIIASQDKDLRTIPGRYLDRNLNIINIEPFEALRWLYTQLLTGDSVDNIWTIPGMGLKTAEKLIAKCKTEVQLFNVVRSVYRDALERPLEKRKFRAEGRNVFPSRQERDEYSVLGEIGKLIYIHRSDRENWWPNEPEINKEMRGIT